MKFAEALQQQVQTLRKLIKEQDEFIEQFKTRQDKAIENWTNNIKQ
jgi:flagellar biosynthesis chaperone FliJ